MTLRLLAHLLLRCAAPEAVGLLLHPAQHQPSTLLSLAQLRQQHSSARRHRLLLIT